VDPHLLKEEAMHLRPDLLIHLADQRWADLHQLATGGGWIALIAQLISLGVLALFCTRASVTTS
jgi:hypothetical protein